MIIFTYIFLLLLMLIIITNGIIFCFKYAPLKIRILSLFVLIALDCRYITLIIFYIHKSINYLYSLRVLYFINILCIPVLALIVLYILSRSDKIKFKLIIIISLILVLLFSILIINGSISLIVLNNSSYTMIINSPSFVKVIYLIINILFMVASIFILNKSNVNKRGISIILLASIVVTCEILLSFTQMSLLPEEIVGDIFWVIALNYALYELKK
jgi:hypothetical protein